MDWSDDAMNYLAHTLLSKNHIEYQLGNLLADPLKGKAWDGCTQHHRDGIAMHKAIDIFTDSHINVSKAKNYLDHAELKGYLKGVVMDILFDHYITKHWDSFVRMDRESFIQSFYRQADKHRPQLPITGQEFIRRLIRYDFFHLYRDFTTLTHVFKKFDQRLSVNVLAKESTSDYLPIIKSHYDEIEREFLLFFPELIEFFLAESGAGDSECYFK